MLFCACISSYIKPGLLESAAHEVVIKIKWDQLIRYPTQCLALTQCSGNVSRCCCGYGYFRYFVLYLVIFIKHLLQLLTIVQRHDVSWIYNIPLFPQDLSNVILVN